MSAINFRSSLGTRHAAVRLGDRGEQPLVSAVASIMETLLHEPPTEALCLAWRWWAWMEASQRNWALLADGPAEAALERVSAIDIPDERLLKNYLARTGGGVVLTCLHMGDYLHAILRLVSSLQGRHVVLLRRRASTTEESRAFAKLTAIGLRFEVVRHGPRAAISVYRALRRGSIAVLMFDLSRRWGEVARLNVLGQPMDWVVGPARLACSSGSVLVPFTVVDQQPLVTRRARRVIAGGAAASPTIDPARLRAPVHASGDPSGQPQTVCEVHRVLDLARPHQRMAIQEVAQMLGDLATRTIRDHPDQWLHWNLLPEMVPAIDV